MKLIFSIILAAIELDIDWIKMMGKSLKTCLPPSEPKFIYLILLFFLSLRGSLQKKKYLV